MSLKEIDFKLRKYLIDNYGLYGEMSTGKITVKRNTMESIHLNWIKVTRRPYVRCYQCHRY